MNTAMSWRLGASRMCRVSSWSVLALLMSFSGSCFALTFTVTNANDSGEGSLRGAILAANAVPGSHDIVFSIPGGGVHVIQPLSPLPDLARAGMTIDGYTQPGALPNSNVEGTNAVLLIEIRGDSAGNESRGLRVAADNVTVRGLVINRFSTQIQVLADSNAVIEGNFIGTNSSGTSDLSTGSGIHVVNGHGHRIGGEALAARNLVSGNVSGIVIANATTTNGVIQGNRIGTRADGDTALGNDRGIRISNGASGWHVGGVGTQANRIAFNQVGILVAMEGTQARILGNHVHGNELLGIDLVESGLAPDGVTPNDPNDVDDGPNALQNFPVLTSARRQGGALRVTGTLDRPFGVTPINFVLGFYASSSCHPSGHGEGEEPIAEMVFVSASGNHESFSFDLPDAAPEGSFVTAMATRDATGESSEFSACVVVTDGSGVFGNGFEATQ